MNVILLSEEQFDKVNTSLNEIKDMLKNGTLNWNTEFLDSTDLFNLFKVSKRTIQSWRSEGHIGYSTIGKKILYRRSDIEELLKRNYIKPLPKK